MNTQFLPAQIVQSQVTARLQDSIDRLKAQALVSDAARRVLPKLTDRELHMVNAGIKNIYLLHDSFETILDATKKVTVDFSYPPIPRKLTVRDIDFCLTWAGYHARPWWVYFVMIFVDDFGKEYAEMSWFNANVKYRFLEDAIDQEIENLKGEGNHRHLTRILWCATIGDKPAIAARAICKKIFGTYNPERPQLRFAEDTLI